MEAAKSLTTAINDVSDDDETIKSDNNAGDLKNYSNKNKTNLMEFEYNRDKTTFPDEMKAYNDEPPTGEILGSDAATPAQMLDAIIDFLTNEDGLDIYQLTAFRVMKGPKPCSDDHWLGYVTDIMKSIVCVLTQITSLIMLTVYIFESRDKELCSMNDGSIAEKFTAGCYCAFLGTILFTLS